MKIETLDDKTVKVMLSKQDMENYSITYDELDYDNPESKKIILFLIDKIQKSTSFDFSKGKLFIEAFPYADGGCILYMSTVTPDDEEISNTKKQQGFDTPLIYRISNLQNLRTVCHHLQSAYNHIILKSSLYYFHENYFLLIYTYFKMDNRISYLLNEYGDFFGKGSVKAALIKEHFTELIPSDALSVINEHTS